MFVRPVARACVHPALLAACVGVAACRSHPKPAPAPAAPAAATRESTIPRGAANGPCGERAAVAVIRGTSARRLTHAPVPGVLVVRVLPADTTMGTPNGPVRLVPTPSVASGGAPRVVKIEDHGVARSGPMPVGRWVVEASGRGFETRRLTVAVRSGATDTVRFRLPRACPRSADR